MNRKDFLKMGIGGVIALTVIPFIKPFGTAFGSNAKLEEEEAEEEYSTYLPNDKPFGISMEEWTHRYWNWYLSFSKSTHNINNDRGQMIMTNQPASSPMFFIPSAGSYEEEYEPQLVRHLRVDHRQGFFFNVLATIADLTDIPNLGDLYKRISDKEMPSAIYKNRSPEGMLHYISKMDMDYTKTALVTLNGEGIPYYRIHSTKAFPIEYAVDNIPGYPPGATLAIQDGFWVFLKPLPKGFYNILIKSEGTHVGMEDPEDSYRKNILNHIEVI